MKPKALFLVLGGIFLSSVGCGGGDENLKKDVSQLKSAVTKLDSKLDKSADNLVEKIRQEELSRIKAIDKVRGMDQEMLKNYQKMVIEIEELRKLRKAILASNAATEAKVTRANKNLITLLEDEYKLLEDRLSAMKDTIEGLKKD